MTDVVKRDVIKVDNQSVLSSSISDVYYREILPFECSITKAKEGSRAPSKFHLFSRTNLRIYDDFESLKNDLQIIETNSATLLQNIEISGFGGGDQFFDTNEVDDPNFTLI